MTDENVFCAADPAIAGHPTTIERTVRQRLVLYDASYGWHDPTRRQLLARARGAGVQLRPAIEVESVHVALGLGPRGTQGRSRCARCWMRSRDDAG